ncbi:beta-propeller domain-containing protein [Nonomuraea sp. NPDC048916]|uniref:beta-propeller domain-containing protein n=1 Tax=Nonomuraea sp. NPDC048916 TaxID=3154232 RepID=UPI0033DA99C0
MASVNVVMKPPIRTALVAMALATAAACTSSAPPPPKQRLEAVRLVSYTSCDELLAGLRERAAENVGAWGFGGPMVKYLARDTAMAVPESKIADTPEHSTTNVHEAGVDEPDLVKTDGNRVITATGGVLRITDTATRKVTASLDLTGGDQPGYQPAELLVSGDRALVLMRGGGMVFDAIAPMGETRYLLVDLSGQPRVLSTIKPEGEYVDARMVGSTVRLVTRSQPGITFPRPADATSEAERTKINQATVRRAPLEAWLPEVEITDASGATRKHSVPCERVSHPADYTGTSLLTLHTIDLAQGVTAAGTDPISLAADGDIVYGTGQSLYVASNPRWWWPVQPPAVEDAPQAPVTEPTPSEPTPKTPATEEPQEETEVHRFDIGKPGAPAYVASGKVPGRLLNQYSLSEHDGHLRIATTLTSTDQRTSSSSVYVLEAAGMRKVGEVGGLGKGERIYSVRFLGPVGYCVTFKQVDPLYTIDLRDPAEPRVTGELKITGYSAYLHPAGEGRLIGIGQEAGQQGRTLGSQVSLFDVSDPAGPRRLSQLFQKDSGSAAEWDPHAFLYWPKTGLSVIPLSSHTDGREGAMVLQIDDSSVTRRGLIEHPRQRADGYQPGIQRSMVIGDSIWTVSHGGVQVNDTTSLARQAWIPLH